MARMKRGKRGRAGGSTTGADPAMAGLKERYPSGRAKARAPRQGASVYVQARRRAALEGGSVLDWVARIEAGSARGADWRDAAAGSLIGAWHARGILDGDEERSALLAEAAWNFARAIVRLRRALEIRSLKAVHLGPPPAALPGAVMTPARSVSAREYKAAIEAYDARHAVLRDCGRDVLLAVTRALNDDATADPARVRRGLGALVDAALG